MKRSDEKQLVQQRSGHRERVRLRFMQNGLSALQPYEVLEYLLFFLIPRKDVKPVAKELLEKFNTISGVLDASSEELQEFGLSAKMADDIAFLREVLSSYNFENLNDRPCLATTEEIVYYLHSKMGKLKKERLMVLYLDYKRQLLGCREFPGTAAKEPVSPREIVESALLFHASAVVLAHTHSSGFSSPKAADFELHRDILDILMPLEIRLADHLILGCTSLFSLMSI